MLSLTDTDRFLNQLKALLLERRAQTMMRHAKVEELRMKEANANIQYFHKQAVLLNAEALTLRNK